jgi:hypothetical protein
MSINLSIAPTDLRDYLKTSGWSVVEVALRQRLYAFENVRYPRRQLVFPMDATAPDYIESVLSVCEKISELNDITIDILLDRVQSLKDDVIRLRVSFKGNDASLPLSFAGTIVQNTEKLLKAAACTALRPRRHHPRLSLTEALQLIEKTKFQQTEHGSFVFKLACPIDALEIQGELALDDTDMPFVRKTTLALQQSLIRLSTAIETDKLDALIDDLNASDSPIISSNLCEAIAAMHDESVDNTIDVDFDWSAVRDVPAYAKVGRIRFHREYFSRIEEVRRELRPLELDAVDTFIGTVERLEGTMDQDGRRTGDVILALLLPKEGETVRARISLSAQDYEQAISAHRTSGTYVCVVGRLRPGRQTRQLTDVVRFELLMRDRT